MSIRSRIDRATVFKYLAMSGAPQPDSKRRYDYAEALAWIEKSAPRAGSGGDDQKKLRTELLRVQLELAQIDLATARRENLPRSTFAPAIAAMMTQLTTDLVEIMERELPPKYHGRTTAECTELNAAGIDRVLKRLKAGTDPLVGKAA